MHSFLQHIRVRLSLPQFTALWLLVAIVAAMFPVAFSSTPHGADKDRSEPFPCQNRPCGCRSAEQCRKHCCCFTAKEKLAWARHYGIMPQEVTAKAADICAAPRRSGCCASKGRAEANTQPHRASGHATKSRSNAKPRHKFVVGVVAQACHGVAQTNAGVPIFVLPPLLSVQPHLESTPERLLTRGMRLGQRFEDPPDPPPRLPVA
jgi:hypothetical protein